MSSRWRERSFILPVMLLFAAFAPFVFSQSHTYAADLPKLDSIRVALFIDGRDTVPYVTLSSAGALTIGERGPGGAIEWFRGETGKPLRFSLDGYRLQIAETADRHEALSVYAAVAAAGHPYLYAYENQGSTLYRVGLDGFHSAESASAAAAAVPAEARRGSAGVVVRGPFYASAGTYGSEAEAAAQQTLLAQHGIVSDIVVRPGEGGGAVWSVWFGEAADAGRLEEAKSAAIKALPGLAPATADTASSYLVRRRDVSGGGQEIIRCTFSSAGQYVWVGAGDSSVKVAERYGRSYRGGVELAAYNGVLAVINELPFEQYLVSVVGSELDESWPPEALKAQAVAARTYALGLGMKYNIAHISDTTYDQAYKGVDAEFPAAAEAVAATRGEVLVGGEGLITPYYYSNSGGMTADAGEVWSTPLSYVKSVSSPDQDAQRDKPIWYRIMLADGSAAYIRSDYAALSDERNPAGLPYVLVQGENVNIRRAPFVDNTSNAAVARASTGDRFVWIGQVIESNAFNWIRGPFDGKRLASSINSRSEVPLEGDVIELEITSRGASGRVTGMKANGREIEVDQPDALRAAMNGLPSTLFDIEQTGKYTIAGAGGTTREMPQSQGVLNVAGTKRSGKLELEQFHVMNAKGEVRVATTEPAFRFVGLGNGHGVGMSQYGARAFAELGYDYRRILKYYYNGVSIVKE